MEAKDLSDAKAQPLTPDKGQQDFFETEAKRPMKVVTHAPGHGNISKARSQFPPSSPTDRMLSPCSRKLLRKKSSQQDPTQPNFDFLVPPANVEIILGSSSQCRRDILDEMGWKFSVMIPDIDERAVEESCTGESTEIPVHIAKAKATAILEQLREKDEAASGSKQDDKHAQSQDQSQVVITSDQVVLFNNEVRGKPRDDAEAREFLASYNKGATCQTVAAVVATHLPSGRQHAEVDICFVHWSGIPEDAHEALLGKEEVYWSCGGFLIEDEDFVRYVEFIDGTLDSIRGLPVKATKKAVGAVLANPATLKDICGRSV